MVLRITLILFISLSARQTIAQQFIIQDATSSVTFRISNLGVSVDGSFKGLKGNIRFDENDLTQSSFNASVETATIETGIGLRDKHLKKEDYFHVSAYPTMTFTSNSVTRTSNGNLEAKGDLQIKNTTRKIIIPFTFKAINNGCLFEGSFKLNRRDFDIGGNSLTLSDEVNVTLRVTATREIK